MEISVVPIGTGSPSVSKYVAAALTRLKKEKDIQYKLTPMSTIIEAGNVGALFRVAEKMHNCMLENGAKRVYMVMKIDNRIDKDLTMKGKIESVKEKIK